MEVYFVIWLLITAGIVVGYFIGTSIERAKYLQDAIDARNHYAAIIYGAEKDKELERKLWINKALVRGGSSSIFPDTVLNPAPIENKHEEIKIPETEELAPPFTSQIRQWKLNDTLANKAGLSDELQKKLSEEIAEISKNSN